MYWDAWRLLALLNTWACCQENRVQCMIKIIITNFPFFWVNSIFSFNGNDGNSHDDVNGGLTPAPLTMMKSSDSDLWRSSIWQNSNQRCDLRCRISFGWPVNWPGKILRIFTTHNNKPYGYSCSGQLKMLLTQWSLQESPKCSLGQLKTLKTLVLLHWQFSCPNRISSRVLRTVSSDQIKSRGSSCSHQDTSLHSRGNRADWSFVDLISPRTVIWRQLPLALFIVTDGGDGGLETEGVVIPGSLGITVRLRYGKGGHNLVLEGKFHLILHPLIPTTNAGKTVTGIPHQSREKGRSRFCQSPNSWL